MSTDRGFEHADTIVTPVDGWSGDESVSIDVMKKSSEAGSRGGSLRSSGGISAAARGFVRLVEGSSPHITSETRDVLQRRLLIAASLFFAGFLAFLVKGWFYGDVEFVFTKHPDVTAFVKNEAALLKVAHWVVTGVFGLMVVWLYRSAGAGLSALRLAEYATFGLTAAFFTLITHFKLQVSAYLDEGAHLPVIVAPWMLLIFTYALFIPNSWRRSLRFLVPATLLPIGVVLMQHNYCAGFNQCVQNPINANYVAEQSLLMSLVCVTAVLGVQSINTLRKKAFEAQQLGQYRLKQKIGSGGMGDVYLGEHQMMKRPCAIKVIRPEKAGDPRTLARFEREVRSTAKLSHWNSVDIYDYGSADDGTFYYVMEYLPGHNVGELVDGGGPLPPSRVVYLMDQVCRALSEAHGMGLVHRDIKPANIFCAYRGGEFDVAKLLDFGLAKPTVEASVRDSSDVNLTQEGAITGSPLFMSPEQATGEREADVRSDIYSLGCVLYYLLTGKPPYPYKQAVKVIIAHASEEAVSPRQHNPALPIELEEVILRCLEKDPEDRFQSVEELRRSLVDIELDDLWTAEMASEWWNCNGCPERKAMAAAAVEAAAV